MLKNIVFDMGNVLIVWDPERILDIFGINDAEDRAIILRELFQTKDWVMQDWGMRDEPETEEVVFQRTPERLHPAIHDCLFHWPDHMIPMPGMKELLKELFEKGYRLFILSNASRMLNDYYVKIPGIEYISDYVVSGSVEMVKPMPEIFQHALQKFGIEANESLFVDDLALNCAGAVTVGMDAFLFKKNAEDLRNYIYSR